MKLILAILLLSTFSFSHTHHKSVIKVRDPFIRLLPPSAPNTGGFLQIENNSGKKISLIKASANISKKVELHDMIMDKGVAKMREVSKIEIAAKSKVSLEPGSLHLMFMGLKKPLSLNQVVSLKLYFDNKAIYTVKAKVLNR